MSRSIASRCNEEMAALPKAQRVERKAAICLR